MKCANCGQTLPDNGVCYNCLKNQNDAKHYGRGSGIVPAYIKYGPREIAPRTRDPGPRRILPERQQKADQQKVSRERVQSRQQSKAKPHNSPKPVQSQPKVAVRKPLKGDSLANQRRGMNKFLEVVFGRPLLISEVLKKNGISDRQIETVKVQSANYLAQLLTTLYGRWRIILTQKELLVIALCYSFNGQARRDKDYLARQLGLSTENLMVNLKVGMTNLRRPDSKRYIEFAIYETARRLLAETHS